MFVCICKSVTEVDVHRAVEQGVTDLRELSERTGCSTECGCCAEFAGEVLIEALQAQSLPLAAIA